MKEYWVNVYEYKAIKNTQFYSHNLVDREEAEFRAFMRNQSRADAKCIYRIHVKMKPVKQALKPKYEPLGIHEKWMDI